MIWVGIVWTVLIIAFLLWWVSIKPEPDEDEAAWWRAIK